MTIDYTSLADEELVVLCKANDAQAVDTLLYRYRAFVKSVARPYFVLGCDTDDFVQEGMIALNGAILSYDADKKASFKTFATMCVKRRIFSIIRTSLRDKRRAVDWDATESDDAIEWLLGKERYEALKNTIQNALSEKEYAVFKQYLNGYTYAEIAEARGISTKQVDNSLQKIKTKLKKAINSSDFLANN